MELRGCLLQKLINRKVTVGYKEQEIAALGLVAEEGAKYGKE